MNNRPVIRLHTQCYLIISTWSSLWQNWDTHVEDEAVNLCISQPFWQMGSLKSSDWHPLDRRETEKEMSEWGLWMPNDNKIKHTVYQVANQY